MKTLFKSLLLFALAAFVLQSCSDDDDDVVVGAPVISNFEVGGAHDEHGDEDHDDDDHEDDDHDHGDEGVVHKGEGMHVGADILAQVRVSSITLEIHGHDLVASAGEVEWDFEQVYTDPKYLVLNPEFHEDIMVPANIPSGEYHVKLTVTDEAGNSTVAEVDIEIKDEDHDDE